MYGAGDGRKGERKKGGNPCRLQMYLYVALMIVAKLSRARMGFVWSNSGKVWMAACGIMGIVLGVYYNL